MAISAFVSAHRGRKNLSDGHAYVLRLPWHRVPCPTTTLVRPLVPTRGVEFFQGTLSNRSEISTARVFDTTLRDGEQSPRTSFSYDDKREIAEVLDRMGTHVIEAGFPANSDAEFEAVSDIAASTTTTTCGLARVVDSDVDAAIDSGVSMVHVFASTSDVQIEDSMHATREEVLERSVEAVERVKDAGVEVMFSPMDATRTDRDYLAEIVSAVDEADVDWINIPDTCGVGTPARFADLVSVVREHTDARIDVHTHDDFGMATANALAGFEAGASQAQVAVNGIGERAGNAAYEEVVMALEGAYGVDTGIDTTHIAELSKIVSEASGIDIPPNKPVVGANAFSHESGIHAAGVIENPATFETGVMDPSDVGGARELVLGKHSGTHSVRERMREAGYAPTDDQVIEVTKRLKEYAAEEGRVTMSDLREFAQDAGVEREREEVNA